MAMYYKYKSFNSIHNEKLFSDSKVYFSNPTELNDPFELSPHILHPEDESEIQQYAEYLVNKAARYENEAGRRKEIERVSDKLREKDFFKSTALYTFKSMGIFCTVSDPKNLLMWSYYSDSHGGFCIGYDFSTEIDHVYHVPSSVEYKDEYPTFSFTDWMNDDHEKLIELFHKIALTKSLGWKHEDEVRFIRNWAEGGFGEYQLKPESIREVILGARISDENKAIIQSWISNHKEHAELYQAHLHDSKYELVLERIN